MKEIADGVFVETEYDGVNVGAIMDRQGFICIDVPSYPRDARDWNSRLERRHPRGARFIMLTDCNGDRVLNTRAFRAPIVTHQYTAEKLSGYEKRYPQQLLDSLIQRNPAAGRELTHSPVDRPSISFTEGLIINSDDREIRLVHSTGPTPGNAWLLIPDAGVLFTGDSVVSDSIPPMADMYLFDWLETLQSFPEHFGNVKTVVPGRGRVSDVTIIDEFAGFLLELKNQLTVYLDAGVSRDELAERVDDFQPSFLPDKHLSVWQKNQLVIGMQHAYDQLEKLDIQSKLEVN